MDDDRKSARTLFHEGRKLIFLDTSYLIDLLRGEPKATKLLDRLQSDTPFVTSTLVMYEFLVGAYNAKAWKKELNIRRKILKKMFIIDFDSKAANVAAEINAQLRKRRKMINGADILIVGSMLSNGISSLVTKNVKHFQKIKQLSIITW
ncbi:MAG: type II toxin-antitoxin system VapC family toxin [Candidatus Ranarchaeia archaeon]